MVARDEEMDSRSQFCVVPKRFVRVGAEQLGAAPSSLDAGRNYRNLFARAREPSQAAGAMLIGKVWARGAIGCSADHLFHIITERDAATPPLLALEIYNVRFEIRGPLFEI